MNLCCAVAAWLVSLYFRSVVGSLSNPIRDNEIRVEYLGISVNRLIHLKLVIAGVLAAAVILLLRGLAPVQRLLLPGRLREAHGGSRLRPLGTKLAMWLAARRYPFAPVWNRENVLVIFDTAFTKRDHMPMFVWCRFFTASTISWSLMRM